MIQPDGSNISEGLISSRQQQKNFPSLVVARIDEILYTDSDKNTTFKGEYREIEYNCTIVGGLLEGTRIFNVKDTVQYGGKFNKSGQVRSAMTQGNTSPPIDFPQKTDGDYVLIALIDNNPYRARIISSMPHPQSNALDFKKDDSLNFFWEFNGVYFGVDSEGAFNITFGGGPKDKEGNPTNQEAAGSSITITKDGTISISDNEGQKIEIDRANKSINLISADKISTQASGNWDISMGGNVKIQAGGVAELNGAIVQIGGSGNLAARVGDLVTGTDSQGGPVIASIQTGSSTTLIGG